MKKILLMMLFASATFAHATDLQELQDAIDEIESKIDNVDLDQSKDGIRTDLDEIKQDLEDLKGTTVVQQPRHSKGLGYRFVPVRPHDNWNNICTP